MNTDHLSSKAYNKSNSESKENENRKKQREIINLTAVFEGGKYMAFSGLQNITAFGQGSGAVLSSAEFFFFLIMDLLGNLLQWHFAIICPAFNKRIAFSSHPATVPCRFVMHCFLPLEDSVTLKRCPVQKVLRKSSQNPTETASRLSSHMCCGVLLSAYP